MEKKDLVFELLMEYKKQNLEKANEDLKNIGNFKKSSFEIKGEKVEVLHNKKHYFMYDESERLFMGNNVDNGDFLTTFQIDVQKYGLVMLALKNLNNKNYFLELVSTDTKEYQFVNHLKYVLSFATMRVGDKVISLKDYFGTPSDIETITCGKCGFTTDLANASGFNYQKMLCSDCSYDEQLKKSFENVRERQVAIQQDIKKKFYN